jgi:hypothetical protein
MKFWGAPEQALILTDGSGARGMGKYLNVKRLPTKLMLITTASCSAYSAFRDTTPNKTQRPAYGPSVVQTPDETDMLPGTDTASQPTPTQDSVQSQSNMTAQANSARSRLL